MFRYGERDFDLDYLKWGFHGRDVQIEEAQSILSTVKPKTPVRILDLACGIGTHAIHWAKQGHRVTGLDISETFISKARETAIEEKVNVEFVVKDINTLGYEGQFDIVTWIENSFFNEEIARRIHKFLCNGGYFVFDVRNPENSKAIKNGSDWRTWREENGIFSLESHVTNTDTGQREDTWITIDPERQTIEEKSNASRPVTLDDKMEMLKRAGYKDIELRTMKGVDFTGGSEPYWLWAVASKY